MYIDIAGIYVRPSTTVLFRKIQFLVIIGTICSSWSYPCYVTFYTISGTKLFFLSELWLSLETYPACNPVVIQEMSWFYHVNWILHCLNCVVVLCCFCLRSIAAVMFLRRGSIFSSMRLFNGNCAFYNNGVKIVILKYRMATKLVCNRAINLQACQTESKT